jgi:hypothetical protein
MLDAWVKQLERLVPFMRKEAVEKEAAEKEDDNDEDDQQSGSSDDNGPVSTIRFPRIKCWLKCPICVNCFTSTRMVCSSISNTSSGMSCHCLTRSNNIAIFEGCSKQPCVTREDHELDVSCLLVQNFDVWWMNIVW